MLNKRVVSLVVSQKMSTFADSSASVCMRARGKKDDK